LGSGVTWPAQSVSILCIYWGLGSHTVRIVTVVMDYGLQQVHKRTREGHRQAHVIRALLDAPVCQSIGIIPVIQIRTVQRLIHGTKYQCVAKPGKRACKTPGLHIGPNFSSSPNLYQTQNRGVIGGVNARNLAAMFCGMPAAPHRMKVVTWSRPRSVFS